ncbi:hypothetical protein DL767_004236 [Monosporascus sp. MG133]|nr:hypothetical protein DL767_004236 [Monosporascus sp. MG133]
MTLPSSKVSKTSNNVPYQLIYRPRFPGRGEPIRLVLNEAGVSYTDTVHVKDVVNSVLAQYDAANLGDAANPPPFAPPVFGLGDLTIRQKSKILHSCVPHPYDKTYGIDGVKSAFPKFKAAAKKSCAYGREFKPYQAVKELPRTKEHLASDRRQKHSTNIYRHYHGAAMRKAAFVFAVAWQSRQAVLAAPMATDIISSYPVTPVETHDKYWASYMKAKGYPSNEDVCRMIRNKENDLFSRSGAEDYYRIWMIDNGFIMVSMNSALQAVDLNELAEMPLAGLDLRTLVRDFVWRENDWQNGDPKMSAIAPTLFILAGLLGPTGGAGLVTQFLVTEEQRVGTIGSFQLNTVAHCLNQAVSHRRGGYLDISKLADDLPTELSGVFDDTNNNIAAITAKLFGGTSRQTLMHIDLTEFVNNVLPATDGTERLGNEAFAPWYLLQQNYHDWEGSTDTLRIHIHNSITYMKIGLIGHLFKLRGLYVMNFAWLERDRCEKEFEGASRYVDGGCFVLKIGGGGWKHLNHDDNAPTELNLAEKKYHLHLDNFFRNVRDCNNDERMMEHGKYGMGELVPADRAAAIKDFRNS